MSSSNIFDKENTFDIFFLYVLYKSTVCEETRSANNLTHLLLTYTMYVNPSMDKYSHAQ